MSSERTTSDNHVLLDDKNRIIAVFRGPQNRQTIKRGHEQILEYAQQLRHKGKPVTVLIDAQTIAPSDTTTGARQQARLMVQEVPFDRFAVCGQRTLMTLAAYIIRLTGKSNNVQFFSSRQRAEAWLIKRDSPRARQSSLSRVTGGVIMLIGLSCLLGWQINNPLLMSWSPDLRPMNPVSALALVLLGFGFITYTAQRLRQLRWIGSIGVVIGIASLLPMNIDLLLYPERVAALGPPGQIATSAAICFIALGSIGLIALRPSLPSRRSIENLIAALVTGIALVNIYGQLYAPDWISSIGPHFAMSLNQAVAFLIAAVTIIVMVLYSRAGVNNLASISRVSLLIITVLILIQIATYAVWTQAVARNHQQAQATFQNDVQDIKNALEDRFTAYSNLLYGFQGLFRSDSHVSQGDFQAYYESTKVAKHYPGLETLTYTSKVNTEDLAAFTRAMQKDTSLNPGGNPNFALSQLSNQQQHYILTYVADNLTTGGMDFSSNPARSEAFRRAEIQQRPTASGTVTYAATNATPVQNGFFITVPISRNDNPNQVIGFVNAVFSYKKFFADTFNPQLLHTGLGVTILDTHDGRTVFAADTTNNTAPSFTSELNVAVADRNWLLSVAGTNTSTSSLPAAVLISGQIFSILLVIIFWLQARARKDALELADSVTKDLQQERNLAVASDQRNRTIFASIGDGIFAVDKHRIITLFNPAAQKISGFAEEQAIGQPYPAILRFEFEKTGKINDTFIKKALSGQTITNANHTALINKNGKYIPIATSAAPIRDSNNTITGAIVVFRDISKEYELEKAKSEFVSLTSHQLRTPLSAINWYAEMLLNGDAGKTTKVQSAYLKEIFEGSNRMSDLVNALLDVSRLEVGKLTSKPEPTDMPALITSLSKELGVFIANKQHNFRTHITHVPAIDADPKQLRMIAQNLMSNAVKYTPPHGTIDVTLRQATPPDMARAGFKKHTEPHWYLSIQDTGYGIPKEDQAKIFEKLFRAENARSLNVEGTGLGLYIVKQVVDKMGGHIWFDSLESVGTTFNVVAPIKPKYKK